MTDTLKPSASRTWHEGVFTVTGRPCYLAWDGSTMMALFETTYIKLAGTHWTFSPARARRSRGGDRIILRVTQGKPVEPAFGRGLDRLFASLRTNDPRVLTLADTIVKRAQKRGLPRGEMNSASIADKIIANGMLAIDPLEGRPPGWFSSRYAQSPQTLRILLALRSFDEGASTQASKDNMIHAAAIMREIDARQRVA